MPTKTRTSNMEFARRVGCHHSMASRIRAGKRRCSLDLLQRISTEFGIPLRTLANAHRKGAPALGELLRKRVP